MKSLSANTIGFLRKVVINRLDELIRTCFYFQQVSSYKSYCYDLTSELTNKAKNCEKYSKNHCIYKLHSRVTSLPHMHC